MKDSFNTDGMYGMPVIFTSCLESIEMTIAFDVRDWSEDRRSAWIYGIVFGWGDESIEELKAKFNWSVEDIERLNGYHMQWEQIKSSVQEECKKEV